MQMYQSAQVRKVGVTDMAKGQLISNCSFGVTKSTKKLFDLTSFKRLGQKFLQKFCWFFERLEDIKRTL